ncbi:hypothetical protein PRIPAC_89590 [Pristionchus pacificus]|uniref:Uncharacterized protein n=1 Tax=Pristionchus pacificus TaxID=54126 RepID=A0A2A6CXW2_PRIPA|nr:hypothetical protein PRIPAC_89590 [Pristionchus pacificus]|eukprot:PDM83062.1 hypothetical protein PRIPAC_37455 [Pristionchus pacificus]
MEDIADKQMLECSTVRRQSAEKDLTALRKELKQTQAQLSHERQERQTAQDEAHRERARAAYFESAARNRDDY